MIMRCMTLTRQKRFPGIISDIIAKETNQGEFRVIWLLSIRSQFIKTERDSQLCLSGLTVSAVFTLIVQWFVRVFRSLGGSLRLRWARNT